MSIIENTWSFVTSRNWSTYGVTFAVFACALTFFNDGNFWLELLSSTLIGAACFCFGANFHKHITGACACTCEESETI
jgi:hypothetical protein